MTMLKMLRFIGICTECNIYRQISSCKPNQHINENSATSKAVIQEEIREVGDPVRKHNPAPAEEKVDEVDAVISGLIIKANNVPTLLQVVTSARKNKINFAFQALDILATWTVDGRVKFVDVENDNSFPKFVNVVEKQANYKSVSEIIKALENLFQMCVPSDNFLVESLQNDLLWNIRRVNISSLLKILIFQSKYQDTTKQKKVLEATLETIERRWTEVSFYHDFAMVYENSKYFKPNFLGHIDDRIVESAENIGLLGLSKIFCSLSISKRRPTPVLRALAFHMFKSNDQLSPKQTVNLIYAMSSLNYTDQALLDKLATDMLPQIEKINQVNVICSFLLCMGKLRWREKILLDALGDWVIKHLDLCRIFELTNLIITLATVSYLPASVNESFDKILSRIDRETVPVVATWVDIVWSLTVLGKVNNELLSSVLDLEFVNEISSDDPAHVGLHIKICNINAYAKCLANSYNGPLLKVPSVDNLLITQSRKTRSLQIYVHKVLHNFLPPPKYICENIRTSFGFYVDAEIVVDSNGRPMPLEQFPSNITSESVNLLPNGAQRIAILIWNFKDYTIGMQELCGFNPVIVKILEKLGYKVLQVPFSDISETGKVVKSVQYFQKRIKELAP